MRETAFYIYSAVCAMVVVFGLYQWRTHKRYGTARFRLLFVLVMLVVWGLGAALLSINLSAPDRWQTARDQKAEESTESPKPEAEVAPAPTPDKPLARAAPSPDTRAGRIVSASRLFAGPTQYPPKSFAAYGILAFPSRATPFDIDRHLMICNVYTAALPHTSEIEAPPAEQMVTVWPISSDSNSDLLNAHNDTIGNVCQIAVANYGLVTAQSALKDAEIAGVDTTGAGPFLLAWSPSMDKGKRDALVLVSDLSHVTTYEQAREIFLAWSRDIERDPSLWSHGWNVERIRSKIRYWVDEYGPKSLALFGVR